MFFAKFVKNLHAMFIFNTTFHIETAVKEAFLHFLKTEYIPAAMESGLLQNPQLARIFGTQYTKGESYALQFDVKNPDTLEKWNQATGNSIHNLLLERFKENVAGFATVLQKIDITQ